MAAPIAAVRGVFVGSGSDGLNDPTVVSAVLDLVDKADSDTCLLYLGTASYDDHNSLQRQTEVFASRSRAPHCLLANGWRELTLLFRGVQVLSCNVALGSVPESEIETMFQRCDIVLVSGGNTLFAGDRPLGLDCKCVQYSDCRCH